MSARIGNNGPILGDAFKELCTSGLDLKNSRELFNGLVTLNEWKFCELHLYSLARDRQF